MAYDWICPKVLSKLRDHPRFRNGVRTISSLEPERPRVCIATAVLTDLMRPIEFPKEFPSPPNEAEWLITHMLEDIEKAFADECDHQFPHFLINLKANDIPDVGRYLFFPCEATRLLGEERGQRVLKDLKEECQQVIEMVKKNGK